MTEKKRFIVSLEFIAFTDEKMNALELIDRLTGKILIEQPVADFKKIFIRELSGE